MGKGKIKKQKKYKYYRITRTYDGIRKEFYGKDKKEAVRRQREYEQSHSMSNLEYADMRFSELSELWLYEIKKHDEIKPATFARYDTAYRNHIRGSRLDNIQICKLKSLDLQLFVNDLTEKGLSPDNIKSVFKVVKMFIRYLYDEDAITKDFSKNVKTPKSMTADSKIRVFTSEEKERISRHIDEFLYPFLIQLGFASGMRLGEMLALQYSDFKDGGVYVNKTLTCAYVVTNINTRKRKKQILTPKSKYSVRFIPLPESIPANLKKHKARHAEILLANGAKNNGYCFTMPGGDFHDSTSINKSVSLFFEKIGVYDHTPHDMRHTYITNLIEAGVPIATVKELAGHSDIQMTIRYTHINSEIKRKSVNSAAAVLTI